MTRKEQIEQASVEYQMREKPVAIAGGEWADWAYRMNINKDFVEGAEWADEHPKDEEQKNKDFEDFVESYMNANDDDILHYYDRYIGLVDGAQWQKEQMTKDVVEAELYLDGDFLTLDYDFVQLGLKEGDKVKLIIIKEE